MKRRKTPKKTKWLILFVIIIGTGVTTFLGLEKINNRKIACLQQPLSTSTKVAFVDSNSYSGRNKNQQNFWLNGETLDQIQKQNAGFSSPCNQKNLLEILVFFSKKHQTKCMVDAINNVFFTTTKNNPLNGKLFARVNGNGNTLSNTVESPFSSTTSPTNNSNKKNQGLKISQKQYNILVGFGPSLEIQPSFNLPNNLANNLPQQIVFKNTVQEQLANLLNSNLDQNQVRDAKDLLYNRMHEFLQMVQERLHEPLQKTRIERLQLTDFTTVPRLQNYSGITAVANIGRDVRLNRQRLQTYFEQAGIANEYVLTQAILDTLHTTRHSILNLEGGVLTGLQFRQELGQLLTNLQTLPIGEIFPNLENVSNATRRLNVNQSLSLATFQLYFKSIPFLKLNPSVYFDSHTKNMAVGIGKACFVSVLPNNETFGFVTGLDIGFRFTPDNNSYTGYRSGGLGAKAFFGVGFQI